MNVVIDIDALNHDSKSGVYYYQQRLIKELVRLGGHHYLMSYLGKPRPAADFGLGEDAKIKPTSWLPRIIYSLSLRTPFGLPYDIVTGSKGDVYIFMKFARWPLWRHAKSIVMIHDTAYLDCPEVIENWHFRRYLEWVVPRSIKRASQVIVNSESTKQSLIRHYGSDPNHITVIVPAIDHDHFKPAGQAEIARVRAAFAIEQPYILSVGTIEPRKNLAGLLKACRLLPTNLQRRYTLVLAGGKGWLDHEINQLYNELSQYMNVIRTGYVADADLPALYSGAAVFAYPSLYEGFGIPSVEALACGTPVITSATSSLPEAVGEAGLLIDPRDHAALAAALEQVLTQPELADRLRKKGFEQAKIYNWSSSAERLLAVINELGPRVQS